MLCRKFTCTMASLGHYKYCMLLAMVVLVLYGLNMDASYPFVEHDIFNNHVPSAAALFASRQKNNKTVQSLNSHCTVYNLTANYKADFECVRTLTSPPTTVCLYSEWTDMYISHDLHYTGLWEPHIVHDFLEIMHKNPTLSVIDIGANIGYYTMIAAAMGRKVVAVEPYLNSIYRIHRAAVILNATSQITVVNNAVSDVRTVGIIKSSGNNQGDIRVKPGAVPCIGSCPQTINIVYLDDLLEVIDFDSAVLKIDIQGVEHKAFSHAHQLLKRIYVPVIFMEWMLMREFYLVDSQTSTDKYIVEEMIEMLFGNNYRPYCLSNKGGHPLNPDEWNLWPDDIIWRKALNDEQMETVMRNQFIHWP